MKKFAFFIIITITITIIALSEQAFASIIISEVLYNPFSSEHGGEAILLYNPTANNINLSGWSIATKFSYSDATLPPIAILAGGYLLIADNNFSLNKDNPFWPDADYEEEITLSNSNAGIALINQTKIIDAIGWGLIEDENLFENNPHPGTNEGQSLRRINNQDTNNNSADFNATTPFFYEQNNSEINIDLEINITNNYNFSFQINRDDNLSKEGNQIMPIAGENKTFEVTIKTNNCSKTATATLENNNYELKKIFYNETTNIFKGNLSMNYWTESGNYIITTTLTDCEGTNHSKTEFFEYESLTSITANSSLKLDAEKGTTAMKTITVKNTGNEEALIKIKSTNPTSGQTEIDADKIEFSIDNFETIQTMNNNFININEFLNVQEELSINLRINTENISEGYYSGEITLDYT
ncbi:hypothetical protein CMO90_00710 [Candidatus Woesearchaeota archaeon]|jgi:hypothetical protein|nr:hypothetical protein [Candidatus Woesearchaeota archaeon]|tara:strand:+ start:1141 stop:2379 length:1239 start_codon:yes stop_codon:yes gene_type:complete